MGNRSTLTRQELLKRGGVVVALGASPALVAFGNTANKVGGTIDFLSWEGYDVPKPMAAWKKLHHVNLKATYISNHDEIQAKIKAGGGGYDLITYYQGYKPLYKELGILKPIDVQKVPNLKNLFPFFASKERNFWVDRDGTRTGVPMFWGSLGLNYDSAVISKPPTTYEIMFEKKWKGKVGVVDDPVGGFTHAGRIVGVDVSKMNDAAFTKVKDYLKRLVKQTKGVSASYGDLSTKLVAGDVVLGWPGWTAVNEFAASAGKKTVKTSLPREGGYSFCDSYAIPTTVDNEDTVLAWINQCLTPRTNAAAANVLIGGVTVAKAVKYLKPEIAALFSYSKLNQLVEKAPFYNNPPVKSDKYKTYADVTAAWQEIKLSA